MNKNKKQKWFSIFESEVIKLDSKHKGKINFESVQFQCMQNHCPIETAKQYIKDNKTIINPNFPIM